MINLKIYNLVALIVVLMELSLVKIKILTIAGFAMNGFLVIIKVRIQIHLDLIRR